MTEVGGPECLWWNVVYCIVCGIAAVSFANCFTSQLTAPFVLSLHSVSFPTIFSTTNNPYANTIMIHAALYGPYYSSPQGHRACSFLGIPSI